ncbi:MAG: right-handed parallel beta-helix repeat-containing protein, partial [Elusimicrobia bacterium]|nr:right-handed parallel beta-helix repeat-containing protein [Elusimicrobiota bacterium]
MGASVVSSGTVKVYFSEPVDASADSAANFSLSPAITINSASRRDGNNATLLTLAAALTNNSTFTATASGLTAISANTLAAASATATFAGANPNPFFIDDFNRAAAGIYDTDTPIVGLWSLAYSWLDAGNSVAIVSTRSFRGGYGFESRDNSATGTAARVTKDFTAAQTQMYLRAYIYLPSSFFTAMANGTQHDLVDVLSANLCPTNACYAGVIALKDGSGNPLLLWETHGSDDAYQSLTTPVTPDAWHSVEIYAPPSVAGSSATFWLDGVFVGRIPANFSGAGSWKQVAVGLGYMADATVTHSAYFDEVRVSTLSYIGPIDPPSVRSASVVDANRVKVYFDMAVSTADGRFVDPSRYTLSPGPAVTAVVSTDSFTGVLLTVAEQADNRFSTVTVDSTLLAPGATSTATFVQVQPTRFFIDDFNRPYDGLDDNDPILGDWPAATTQLDGGNTLLISTVSFRGGYGLVANDSSAGGYSARLRKRFASGQTQLSMRVYINLPTSFFSSMANGDQHSLAAISSDFGDRTISVIGRKSAGGTSVLLFEAYDSLGGYSNTEIPVTADAWHAVELYAPPVGAAVNPSYWLDGNLVWKPTINFSDAVSWSTVTVGFGYSSDATDVHSAYFDEVKVSTSGYIGPLTDEPPAGCAIVRSVSLSTGPFTTIQSAVNDLPNPLTGHSCVVIKDNGTYPEQVTVRNFVNNGSSITIMAQAGYRPTVSPPAASTAAFLIQNSSVNILRLNIIPTNALQAGVSISSPNVTLSSISLQDGGGKIWGAGIAITTTNWVTVSNSSMTLAATGPAGFYLYRSSGVTIANSTTAVSNAAAIGVYMYGSSSNSFTGLYASNVSGAAFQFDFASNYNTISLSTITGNEASGFGAFHFDAAATNTVTNSYIGGAAGVALNLQPSAYMNTISFSTIANNSASWAAANFQGASSNTVTDSWISNPSNNALYVQAQANGNLFQRSTITVNVDFAAVYVTASGTNTISNSYVQNLSGNGINFDPNANSNRVNGSTVVIASANSLRAALLLVSASSNTVSGGAYYNSLGNTVILKTASNGNSLSLSTMTSVAAGYYALSVAASSANTVMNSYIQGSTAAYVSGSTSTVFGGTVFVATNTNGSALQLEFGSVNLTVSSSSLKAPSGGVGIYLSTGNAGALIFSSNTITGAKYGMFISTQQAGVGLSVSSLTFANLTSGATAVLFDGGPSFVSTFSAANFDASCAVNVYGKGLTGNATKRVTMLDAAGVRAGAANESDPYGRVDWTTSTYAGCVVTSYVGAGNNATITAGLAGLPTTLTGHSCVVIRDGATYSEQVTVRNFTNNGSSITIMADVGFSPVVNPPVASTAAFLIQNSSVNILRLTVISTNAVNYGVYASSAYITMSSVSVQDAGGFIKFAGVQLSSWNAVSYSSVTVDVVYAFYLPGSTMTTISYSSAQSAGNSRYALFLQGASSNTVTGGFFANSVGNAVGLESGANYNSISLSTLSALASNRVGLLLDAALYNTVAQSYISGAAGGGAYISNASNFNTFSQSTFTSAAAAYYGYMLDNGNFNTLDRSFVRNANGPGVFVYGNFNTISYSTLTSNGAGEQGLKMTFSATNTITNSYIQGSTAAYIVNSTGTVINSSVLVATNTAGDAVSLAGGDVNLTIASSTLIAPALGRGLALSAGNIGVVSLGSVTFSGAGRGVELSTQGAIFTLAVDSITFRNLASGATAIHFLGGTFVATVTLANFEDSTSSINVNGSPLSAGSRITMRQSKGSRRSALYENDSNSFVDWPDLLPAGCSYGLNVKQDGTEDHTSIKNAVDALAKNLLGPTCVVVRDTQTYSEQVTVQGFTNNGYRLTIMADPSFVSSAPVLSPLAGSTAAFQIANTSISILGINIKPTTDMYWAVRASSAQVILSSVNINDTTDKLWLAGIQLSSRSAVSYSSVTMVNAHGLYLTGELSSITQSTIQVNSAVFAAAYLEGASTNTFTLFLASNPAGRGVYIASAAWNTISQSTINTSGFELPTLYLTGSSSNTVTRSVLLGRLGDAMWLEEGSHANIFSWNRNTSAATSAAYTAAYLHRSAYNTLRDGYYINSVSDGIYLDTDASGNQVLRSTVTSGDSASWALSFNSASSNTVSDCWISNPVGTAVNLNSNSGYNTIAQSTITSSASAMNAIELDIADFNVFDRIVASNLAGRSLWILGDSDDNLVKDSRFTGGDPSYTPVIVTGDRNEVRSSLMTNSAGPALRVYTWSGFFPGLNQINASTMTSGGTGMTALNVEGASATVVSGSYIQGWSAADVVGSTGTVFNSNVFIATNNAGVALQLTQGSQGLTVASSTLRGGPVGTGYLQSPGNSGTIAIGSVTLTGSAVGVSLSTMSGAYALSITSVNFRSLTNGATAVQFAGGTFVATITLANFEDGTSAVNVNGSPLSAGSRITMRSDSGARTGPYYENDPNNLVYWAEYGAKNWTNAAGDLNWHTAGNWSPEGVPGEHHFVTIDRDDIVAVSASSPAITFAGLTLGDAAGSFSPTLKVSTTIVAASGWLTVFKGATLEQSTTMQLVLSSGTVMSGGLLTHTANPAGGTRSMALSILSVGDFDVQAGATISVAGKGYAGGTGGAAGSGSGGGQFSTTGGGGGHGGGGGGGSDGLASGGAGYDSLTGPSDLGSGGGAGTGATGGVGGGILLLDVGGTLTLNGLADGSGAAGTGGGQGAGGGGGGALNLNAATLSGSGTLRVNGGNGLDGGCGAACKGGGGGGGRIALRSTVADTSSLALFAGAGASGGGAAINGGAGVIAVKRPAQADYKLLVLSTFVVSGATTRVLGAALSFTSVTIQNASLVFDADSIVTASDLITSSGASTISIATMNAAGFTVVSGTGTIYGSMLNLTAQGAVVTAGTTLVPSVSSIAFAAGQGLTVNRNGTILMSTTSRLNILGNVNLQPGAFLTHAANGAARSFIVNIGATGNFDVQAGSTIGVDGLGYSGGLTGNGPGGGQSVGTGGGGGHGGAGGNGSDGTSLGGAANDSLVNPVDLGSGGGAGAGALGGGGGGAVILTVQGTLALNGLVSATGGVGTGGGQGAGGGAGGTIKLTAGTLSGVGKVRAGGGPGLAGSAFGGGGGGGRIALTQTTCSSSLDIAGLGGASGGGAAVAGSSGTWFPYPP